MIEQYGKGAIKTPLEIASTRFAIRAEPPRVIDWDKGYAIENSFTLTQRDQNGSSSCTGQATCYYCEALEKLEHQKDERYSARYNYSQSYAPGGGAYIWKAMSVPLKAGCADANSVPDEDSSESLMIDQSLNSSAQIEAKTDKYAQLPNYRDIDQLAAIIEDYGGFITGFNGNNNMFLPDGTATIPSTVDWGHAVYVCGHKIKDGKKMLVFKNSWSDKWGTNGYGFFPEDFVKLGPLFDAYVYATIEDLNPTTMENRFVTTDKDVYLVRDGKRSLIYNALAFSLVSGQWNKIEKITLEQLNIIPDTGKVLAGLDQE